jgi:hypothetical protein
LAASLGLASASSISRCRRRWGLQNGHQFIQSPDITQSTNLLADATTAAATARTQALPFSTRSSSSPFSAGTEVSVAGGSGSAADPTAAAGGSGASGANAPRHGGARRCVDGERGKWTEAEGTGIRRRGGLGEGSGRRKRDAWSALMAAVAGGLRRRGREARDLEGGAPEGLPCLFLSLSLGFSGHEHIALSRSRGRAGEAR